ncbi:outer membrane beta-barrel protein [Psychroserpens sp. SPM9]|uniref:outer membrane beta-barrel protein n=1 Tax=Psychroserpens sp. SPM9 TaxID=2975598 RepID=UPI0021A94973|nr:outer membrane beta-barrel protein [Psychroserpens sp. SPM9]MDG5492728.1 outer membrane beta-barrel protein [Psychroserpens sp. SPM9]
MKKLLLFIALLSACFSFSQSTSFKISGTILAQDDKSPLESATIYLERVKDSSLVTYTISDKDGKFEIINDTYDDKLNLFIDYVGYQTYYKQITIDKDVIDLEIIELKISNALDEVVIKSRSPITIKKDTLEFNVKSFKTKKDANVEDLLKQLPGVEVDEAGKITVNGKDVSKILVNGKPFFGDDPTITTRNLTKDIIEKVQITDTKSKSEAFAGEEGDTENKTINLTIKEENNKGVFGRLAAGAGTEERYEYAGMVNVFDNDRRISVLAGGNNTNSPGFSFGEIQKMFGGGYSMSINSSGAFTIDGRSFGGGQGITTSQNIGANFADTVGDNVEVNADYFYSGSDSENETITQRENILPDSRFFSDSRSKSINDGQNHSANLGFDIEIDSTFLINVNPSFRWSTSNTSFTENEETRDEDNALTNQSTTASFAERDAKNFGTEFDLTKRFGDKGAFLKFEMDNEFNTSNSDDFLTSETNFFNAEEDDIIRDQYTDSDTRNRTVRLSTTYRLPIKAKELFLDFSYSFRDEKRTNLRSTFDRDTSTNLYDDFNFDLSTDFEYDNQENTPSVKLSYRKDKWSTSVTTSYVFRTLENKDFLRPELNLKRNFQAVELRANFNYRFSPKASMYSGYSLNNSPPSLTQLQPFQNVSNPLNTVTGNPNLEPTNNHRLYMGYNAFDFQKKTGIYSYASINFNNNQVVSRTIVDPETLKRTTTYANVNGNYNAFGNINYSKTIKADSLKTIKYDVGMSVSLRRNINFNNEVQYKSNVTALTPSLGLRFTWPKVMEFRPRYRLAFTKNTYDISTFEDVDFLRHDLDLNFTTYLPKHFEWTNNVDFSYNPNVAPGFQKSAWFWNSTLAYSFMKDKAVLTLKVYDLLNQNTNARRRATENYIEDRQSTVLQQFVMLSFSWKFNSLGSKGNTDSDSFFIMD